MIGDDSHTLQSYWSGKTNRCPSHSFNRGGAREFQFGNAHEPLDLDLVRLMVSPNQDSDGLLASRIEERFDQLLWGNFQDGGHFFDRPTVWRGNGSEWPQCGIVDLGRREHFGPFHVGSIGPAIAVDNGFFSGLGEHHEFMG